MRKKIKVEYYNKMYTLEELEKLTGTNRLTIYSRYIAGKKDDDLIARKSKKGRKKGKIKKINFKGELLTFREIGSRYKILPETIRYRYNQGLKDNDLITNMYNRPNVRELLDDKGNKTTYKEIHEKTGLKINTIKNRYYRGLSYKDIIKPVQENTHFKTKIIKVKGKKYTYQSLSDLTGISKKLIRDRYAEGKRGIELIQPKQQYKKIEYEGNTYTYGQLARKLGLNVKTLRNRYDNLQLRGQDLLKEQEVKTKAQIIKYQGDYYTFRELSILTGVKAGTLKYRYNVKGYRENSLVNSIHKPKLRNNVQVVRYQGEYYTFTELSNMSGIQQPTIRKRYRDDLDLLAPVGSQPKRKTYVMFKGKKTTLKALSDKTGLNNRTLRDRYHAGLKDDDLIAPIGTYVNDKDIYVNGKKTNYTQIGKKYNMSNKVVGYRYRAGYRDADFSLEKNYLSKDKKKKR